MKKAFIYAALNFLVAAAIWILPELVFSLISSGVGTKIKSLQSGTGIL